MRITLSLWDVLVGGGYLLALASAAFISWPAAGLLAGLSLAAFGIWGAAKWPSGSSNGS